MERDKVFTNWVNQYTDKLYSWTLYKTSSKEVAEDIVQDTFLSVYSSMDKFENKSEPYTWIMSILNNKIIDYYKKNVKNIVKPSNEPVNGFDDNGSWLDKKAVFLDLDEDELLDNSGFVETLENCYENLPDKWRKSIQAKYILNINSSEICQELGITPSNYWKIIQRAKLQLKGCLELNWF